MKSHARIGQPDVTWEVHHIPSRETRFGRRRQRWAVVFVGRQAERRLKARMRVLHREILAIAPTRQPFMEALKNARPS